MRIRFSELTSREIALGSISIRIVSGIALAALAAGFSGCAGTPGDTPEPGVAQQPAAAPQTAQAAEPAAPPPHMPKDLAPDTVKATDEFLWLEDVNGKKSLAWVKEQNARTEAAVICAVRSMPRNVSIGTSALTTSEMRSNT